MQSLLTLISLPAPACLKRSGCGTRNQASSPGIREPRWPPPPCPGSSVTTPASRPSPVTPSTSSRTGTGSSDAPASGAWTCQPGGRAPAQGTQVKQHWSKLYELGKRAGWIWSLSHSEPGVFISSLFACMCRLFFICGVWYCRPRW